MPIRPNRFKKAQDSYQSGTQDSATRYARMQSANARGAFAHSRKHVAMMTCESKLRAYVERMLMPVVKERKYVFLGKPSMDQCINAQVVIMDGRPLVNSRMHSYYDKMVRIKKSMAKFGKDMLCVVGPKEQLRDYSRGTYGKLHYFALDEQDPEARDEQISVKGVPYPGGPVVYNFADMAEVVDTWIREKKDFSG